jgi:hypothetical protein
MRRAKVGRRKPPREAARPVQARDRIEDVYNPPAAADLMQAILEAQELTRQNKAARARKERRDDAA